MLLTIENSDVSSAKSLVVDEMPSATSLMYIRKTKDLKLNLAEHQQTLESMKSFDHLVLLFAVCYWENFELVSVVAQSYPKVSSYR